MALVLADRVKETTTTTGTGTVTLLGAATGYQSFAAVGNANTTYYTIAGQTSSEWEVGIGTYTSSGTTLSRDTVLSSSNSGSLVTFSAGTKDVFVTYPSSRSIYANGAVLTATNSSVLPIASGGTALTTFTANQIHYGSFSQSAGLTFDGTNLATTGTATAAKLIPTGTSVTGNGMYLPATNSVGISTNGTNAVYINASQQVSIGSTGSSGRLYVVATGSQGGIFATAVNNHGIYAEATGTGYGIYGRAYNISYGGAIGFDSANTTYGILGYAGYGLYTNASINVNGTVYTSDRRLKENDQNITNALSQVMQLRAVSFDWKADSSRGLQKGGVVSDYGFIAQEVETIMPNLVYSTTTPARPAEMTSQISLEEELGEYKGIDYSRFVPFLTAAIQEQQALITQLTNRIAALEAK